MTKPVFLTLVALATALALATGAGPVLHAQDNKAPEQETPVPKPEPEGQMTLERLDKIVKRLDAEAKNVQGYIWQFKIEKVPVVIVTDEKNDRMRILVAIRSAEDMTQEELNRVMQANFDSALDSRYAIAKDILWSAFVHPLKALHDRQFIAAIGQTVNLAATYGTTFSSGLLMFGGGDSQDIIRRKLIDDLLKKGTEI